MKQQTTRVPLLGLVCLLIAVTFISPANHAQAAADLVLFNGKIWSVNERQPEAEAVACLGNKIIAVGANAQIRKLIGANRR